MIFINMKLFEEYKTILEEARGKHLIIVDVQPEYQDGFGDMAIDMATYINENIDSFTNITFLYNGPNLGMIEEHEYRNWWHEQGLDEEIAFDAFFYDKGYAFFRYCMDSGIDDDSTINLIRYMVSQNVHDSRELDKEFWNGFIDMYGDDDIRELLEFSDDAIHIPDLMDLIKNFNNIVLTGGGVEECLREVVLALEALGKNYTVWDQFTY